MKNKMKMMHYETAEALSRTCVDAIIGVIHKLRHMKKDPLL